MRKWQLIPKTKERKYPIKRDEYGQSARSRAFAAFDAGKRPAEIYEQIGISKRTANRYFADWKEYPKELRFRIEGIKQGMKKNSKFSNRIIAILAKYLKLSPEEVEVRLEKPWGLQKLIKGFFTARSEAKAQSAEEARLIVGLRVALLMENLGIPPHAALQQFKRVLYFMLHMVVVCPPKRSPVLMLDWN